MKCNFRRLQLFQRKLHGSVRTGASVYGTIGATFPNHARHEVQVMDRRQFLKSVVGVGTLATAGGLATPAISQRTAARALRLVPRDDLANFHPGWSGSSPARSAGLLVWDMLYGVADTHPPARQPVDAEGGCGEASAR